MGWELHIVRTDNWFDSASDPSTKHPDEALYCKMLQVAEKLNAVVVDDDDHKYLLPSDLMNTSWALSFHFDQE
ncbi:hypothetical protein [Citrobacter braakii]|uniref:hypothetical protein n=1 Tax=Citrobacter TaxID=544 RepID=UPI00242EE50C|nr:hypothetical protein [Citrobacter braakii]WFW67450.1 hypothetical protein NFJ78_14505 [Citrobacter braakii]